KQLMARGFLYCDVVLVLGMCGIAPATAQFPPPPHFQRHRRKLSPSPAHPKARKLLRLQAHQSSEIGAVNSPRSAAKRPINSTSSSAPEGQRQRILTSIAQERLLASGRRCPDGTITVARAVTIWRCSGLAVSKPTRSSLTARSQKSSMECVA